MTQAYFPPRLEDCKTLGYCSIRRFKFNVEMCRLNLVALPFRKEHFQSRPQIVRIELMISPSATFPTTAPLPDWQSSFSRITFCPKSYNVFSRLGVLEAEIGDPTAAQTDSLLHV